MQTPKDERALSAQADQNEQAGKPRRSFRENKERLYDKIGRRVSLRALDIFIYAIIALTVVAIVVGVVTGQRT